MSRHRFKYDAALSFAGDDRKAAERLAKSLKSRGLRVFYDRDHLANLWGKRQSDFEGIYGPQSRFVIPFVSQNYAQKDWTRLEFESAKREAKRRAGEFILPIRLDDTVLLGLSDDQVYVRLGELSISEIADIFAQKCGKCGTTAQAEANHTRPIRHLPLLSQTTRQALGLLTTSWGITSIQHLQQLFPEIDWASAFRSLARAGLIRYSKAVSSVPQRVQNFLEKEPDWPHFNERWISALAPIKDHFDAAPFLAIHYLLAGRDEDCVNTLADTSEGPSLGSWNEVYLAILEPLAANPRADKMAPEVRCRLYNATGICLTHVGRYDEALKWFSLLRTITRRSGSKTWRGQCHLNLGVVCLSKGERNKAIQYFRRAIDCGKATKDHQLIARAEGNLAPLIAEQSPPQAIDLLNDSLSRKIKMGDALGVAVTRGQLGQVLLSAGQVDEALKSFAEAKKLALKMRDEHTLALTLQNIGSVHFDLRRLGRALVYYRRAHHVARKNGYVGTQLLAAICEGRTYYEMRRYRQATRIFRAALALSTKAEDHEGEMASLHALGVLSRLLGRPSQGRALLRRALEKARVSRSPEWISRCQMDGCRRIAHAHFSGFNLGKLEQAARTEQSLRNWGAAGRLWEAYGDASTSSEGHHASIESAYKASLACFENASDATENILQILTKLHIQYWQVRQHSRALRILSKVEHVARRANRPEDQTRAIDQRGVCLQELGEYREAEHLHSQAIRNARKLQNKELLAATLNNLGEALRKLERHDSAIRAFKEAEEIASSLGDADVLLLAAGNRVLALLAKGDVSEARRLLRTIRDAARRHRKWSECALFRARLAQLSCDDNDVRRAKNEFEGAIAEAKRHKQFDVLPRITLAYSRLLLDLDQPRRALSRLRRYEDHLPKEPDHYLFHYTLGELYWRGGELGAAERHFRSGKLSAAAAQDRDYTAMCAAMLAEIHEERCQYAAAEKELRIALANEPVPEGRALLLTQVLRVQLSSKALRSATKTFNKVTKLASDLELSDVLVDTHLMIGRHEWDRAEQGKLEAMKACAVALLHALEISVESYSAVLIEIIRTLVRPGQPAAVTEEQFAALIKQLYRWVSKEIGNGGPSVQLITWPFELAKRLLPVAGEPRKLRAELRRLCNADEAVRPS